MNYDELIEHFKYPYNKKDIQNPDFATKSENPSCGDKISIQGKVSGNKVMEIGFGGSGCVVSQAAASLLTEYCKGKPVDELMSLNKEKFLSIIKIELGPSRLRCAMLSLQALQEALADFKKKNN